MLNFEIVYVQTHICVWVCDLSGVLSSLSLGGSSVAGHRPEDGVLEAVLFSMGRTMSQDDVLQLMQRTVQQVAGTLSLDLDRAQHLLVHCKWNVDLLIQRYTDDPDVLVLAAGLKIRNPQPPLSPAVQCPVCLMAQSGGSEPTPTLCCNHYCCRVRHFPSFILPTLSTPLFFPPSLFSLFHFFLPSHSFNHVLNTHYVLHSLFL